MKQIAYIRIVGPGYRGAQDKMKFEACEVEGIRVQRIDENFRS